MKNISKERLRQVPIPIPPKEQRRAIASIGEAFDFRLTAERSYLSRLLQVRAALSQALLTGRVRIKPVRIVAEAVIRTVRSR